MATAPSDVLCSVFKLLPFVDRVRATHVCKHWRMASLSSPGMLWSRIVSTGRRHGVLRQLLERSQRVPIDVEVLLRDHTFEGAMASVSQHLSHIRRLHLYSQPLGEDEPAMRNIPRIYDALAVPAPLLEHLDIGIAINDWDPDDYDSESDESVDTELEDVRNFDCRIPVNLFSGYAPCLRRVAWLSMVLPPDGVPAFANVTHYSFAGHALSASHLAAIVDTLPHLTSLAIKVENGYELPATGAPSALFLEELELQVWNFSSEQSLVPLLQYLRYHSARLVTTDRFPEWLELLVAPPRGLPHALYIHDGWTGLNSWQMRHPGDYVSQGHSLFTNEVLTTALARDVFAALETFVAHISIVVAPAHAVPPLSQLARLVLHYRGRDDVDRLFATVSRPTSSIETAWLLCPQLRTLEIRNAEPDSNLKDMAMISVSNVELLLENVFVPAPASAARPHVTLRHVDVPFPRPERFWGRPIEDGLTVTHEYADMPMHWEGSDWDIRLDDRSLCP